MANQQPPRHYEDWPFRPPIHRSIEQNEQWWQRGYVPGAADRQLGSAPHWTIVTGQAGSGKSVSLAAWARAESRRSFVVEYPPAYWPGSERAWLRDEKGHLAQMMATAAIALRNFLFEQPEQAAGLDEMQREFLRWLLERVQGERAYDRWVKSLPPVPAQAFAAAPQSPDLFGSLEDPRDVRGMIEELVSLVNAFGLRRVAFTIDVNSTDDKKLIPGLADLFGWLDLAHYPGLVVCAAAPGDWLDDGRVLSRARGRVSVIYQQWTAAEGREIADRLIRLATGDSTCGLDQYAAPEVVERMGQIIEHEYGQPTPRAWLQFAQTLLYLTERAPDRPAKPVTAATMKALISAYYAGYIPLRINHEKHGVDRGRHFIRLEKQSFEFIKLLQQLGPGPVSSKHAAMTNLAGPEQSNVHTIASRTRKAIEPEPSAPAYLKNERDPVGYWLEHCEG